jgi:DNA-binding transcriptional ArsR family regulator
MVGKQQDLLATVRAEIEARRDRLQLAVAEYEQLLSAAAALEQDASRSVPAQVAAAASKKPVRRKAGDGVKTPARRARSLADATPAPPAKAPKAAARPQRGAAAQAIMAALEHGSHTVAELVVVTALAGPSIRESLRALGKAGSVTRTKRDGDGKAAYALAS